MCFSKDSAACIMMHLLRNETTVGIPDIPSIRIVVVQEKRKQPGPAFADPGAVSVMNDLTKEAFYTSYFLVHSIPSFSILPSFLFFHYLRIALSCIVAEAVGGFKPYVINQRCRANLCDKFFLAVAVTFHNNQPIIGKTKSDAGFRIIPLGTLLTEILRPYRQLCGFIIGDGKKPLTERTFTRMWQRIGKTIDLHGATPHTFRHTYITLAASSGIDVKTLQAIAGHSDIKMTLDRYAHKREEKIIEAGPLISHMFSSL